MRATQCKCRRREIDLFGEMDRPECICRRGAKPWWDKAPGWVKDEVRAALRRPAKSGYHAKRNAWGGYKPLDYSLPRPTLAASSKRLADAELKVCTTCEVEDDEWDSTKGQYVTVFRTKPDVCVETFTGPRAAEQYVAYRRAQLGLDLEMAA